MKCSSVSILGGFLGSRFQQFVRVEHSKITNKRNDNRRHRLHLRPTGGGC